MRHEGLRRRRFRLRQSKCLYGIYDAMAREITKAPQAVDLASVRSDAESLLGRNDDFNLLERIPSLDVLRAKVWEQCDIVPHEDVAKYLGQGVMPFGFGGRI